MEITNIKRVNQYLPILTGLKQYDLKYTQLILLATVTFSFK